MNEPNDTIHHAGPLGFQQDGPHLIPNGHKPTVSEDMLDKEEVEQKENPIILYEGWNPINYK